MRLRDDDDKAWLGRSFYDWSFAKCVILIVLGDKSSAGGITIKVSHCLLEHFVFDSLNKQQQNTSGYRIRLGKIETLHNKEIK